MRRITGRSCPLMALLGVLVWPFASFQSGCASKPQPSVAKIESKTPSHPLTAESVVPDRPEKLTFAPLKYEPPSPQNFRVALKNGPVSYVVPDHELPLVNLVIYVRTGEYVEPEGKEASRN